MKFCGFCGTSLPTNARFCGECGRATELPFTALPTAPPTSPPSSPPAAPITAQSPIFAAVEEAPTTGVVTVTQGGGGGLLAVMGLLGLIAAAVGIFVLTRPDDSPSDASATTGVTSATTLAGGTTTETTTTATTLAIDPAPAASEQLQQLITQDQATVDTLVGSWVVQLSAKRVGLKADGIEYGPVEILADHTTLRDTYGAVLVDAGAFQFQSDGSPMIGWFLSIVPEIYGAKEAATQWCIDNGLPANRCLARRFPQPNS